MNGKKVTYEQISKASGISLATISRVINKKANVTEQTRNKVIKAMTDAGMDTSALESSPEAYGKLLLFNVPSMGNIFYSPIITSSKLVAFNYGYTMVVNEDPLDETGGDGFLNLIKQSHVAGVISTSSVPEDIRRRITALCPLVLCCEGGAGIEDVPYVAIDNEAAAFNAVRYLLSLGRTKVALINGPSPYIYAKDRFAGYCRALESAGLKLERSLVAAVNADMDYDMAKAVALSMLSSPVRPDAFFCISDVIAAAVVRAALELGLNVPDDVSVIGFDDLVLSSAMNPAITTVRQPCVQLGAVAMEMLIKLIRKEEPVNSLLLGTELVIRESTSID